MAENSAIDPKVKHRLKFMNKFKMAQLKRDQEFQKIKTQEEYDPEKIYTEKVQDIYQRNMSNLIRRQVTASKFGKK